MSDGRASSGRGEAEGDSTPEDALEPRPGSDGSQFGGSKMRLSARSGARLEGKDWRENDSRLAPTDENKLVPNTEFQASLGV